jgi:aminomethyltransferase
VVGWDKERFRGRDALIAQREAGVDPVLRGLLCEGRRPPREGHEVVVDGRVVGRVTSGNFSPVLGLGIALAATSPEVVVGDDVVIRGPSAELAARCVDLPFVAG